jgi:H+-transporting ATPase
MWLSARRQVHAPEDDIEARAADNQNNPNPGATEGTAATASGSGAPGTGAEAEHVRFSGNTNPPAPRSTDLSEFEALDRYITNAEQERRASLASSARTVKPPKWWQFWKTDPEPPLPTLTPNAALGKPPDSWLETPINTGLSSNDIEERRKRFGWNELKSEKENVLEKILSYFRGPILYGKPAN